jgi:hypothetical protein
MAFIKTMTIDGYFSKQEAINLSNVVFNLSYQQFEFGKEIDQFNLVPENSDEIFSNILGKKVEIDKDSGIFRIPDFFIHFESFTSPDDWLFVVALQQSTFNIYEHQSGAKTALDDYKFNYQNLFEWDLTVNHILEPGQGIFFRPWLFHSFDKGLIQLFKLKEIK